MKANKIFFSCLTGIVLTVFLFAACKKSGYTVELTTDDSQTQAIIARDELLVSYEFDQAVNEALLASSVSRIVSGNTDTFLPGNVLFETISHVVIDTMQSSAGIIKLIYYGKNADETKGRTGEITIKHAVENGVVVPWKTEGAVATITFDQYEVVNLDTTNRQLWINGSCTITNVSGGLLKKARDMSLQPGDSLVDRFSAQLIFSYNDNVAQIVTWAWNFTQQRSFVLNDTMITATFTGDSIINNVENISTSGMNRFEDNFYTKVTAPVVQNIPGSFLLSDPVSGSKVINEIAEPILIIYGVSEQGNIVSSGVPFGYKIVWTNSGGERKQTVVSY